MIRESKSSKRKPLAVYLLLDRQADNILEPLSPCPS
jgi:hypothetical protein